MAVCDRLDFALLWPVRHHGRFDRRRHRSRRRCPAARHRHAGQFRHDGDADLGYRRRRRLQLFAAALRGLRSAIRRRPDSRPPACPAWRSMSARLPRSMPRWSAGRRPKPVACQCRISVATSSTSTVGQFQDHHRRAADHAQLHADPLDGLGLGGRRQQRRHAGARHAQRQRERQYQRRVLHPGWRGRPQRRAEPRHDFRVKDPDISI